MNLTLHHPTLPLRWKRCRADRAAFTSPMLPWLLVLVPTLGLLIPCGLSLWEERSAKQFLQRETVNAEAALLALPLSSPVDEQSELTVHFTSAIRVLRDRKQFFGDENDPRVTTALVKDAAPLFKLIEQNIEDDSKAKLMGVALTGNYWLLDARFYEASKRDDMKMKLETLRWSARLSPPQANAELLLQQHRWIESIVTFPTAIEPTVLKELDSLLLQMPVDIESRNHEILMSRKQSLLSDVSNIQSYRSYTLLMRWYRELESLEQVVRPESLLQSDPQKLLLIQRVGPFAYSLADASSNQIYNRVDYFHQFARSMEQEDERRRLRLAIAARLQAMESGAIPQLIDELVSPDLQVPLIKSSIWGMPYQLTTWQIELDGTTRDLMKIHPVGNPSESAARHWCSPQNSIVRLQPIELTLLLRETTKLPHEN